MKLLHEPQASIRTWMRDVILALQGNFNKLKMLQKMLNDTPLAGAGGVGWLWWLDIDTVVDPAQVCHS